MSHVSAFGRPILSPQSSTFCIGIPPIRRRILMLADCRSRACRSPARRGARASRRHASAPEMRSPARRRPRPGWRCTCWSSRWSSCWWSCSPRRGSTWPARRSFRIRRSRHWHRRSRARAAERVGGGHAWIRLQGTWVERDTRRDCAGSECARRRPSSVRQWRPQPGSLSCEWHRARQRT